jgi:CBS domain-containing protein
MKNRNLVKSIMTPDPISVKLENKISDIELLFSEYNIRHVPVVEKNELVGIISKFDMEKLSSFALFGKDDHDLLSVKEMPVSNIMTRVVYCIQEEDEIKKAAKILGRGFFHAIPVLEGKELKGIVTSSDIINYALDIL